MLCNKIKNVCEPILERKSHTLFCSWHISKDSSVIPVLLVLIIPRNYITLFYEGKDVNAADPGTRFHSG